MPIPSLYMPLLVYLDAARLEGFPWQKLDAAVFPYQWRHRLQSIGLIESRGKTHQREYAITEAGTLAVVRGETPVAATPPLAELTVISNGHSDSVPPHPVKWDYNNGPQPADVSAQIAALEAEPDEPAIMVSLNGHSAPVAVCVCTDQCVYRQALDIIAARLPEARDLVAVLEKINRI